MSLPENTTTEKPHRTFSDPLEDTTLAGLMDGISDISQYDGHENAVRGKPEVDTPYLRSPNSK